MSETQNDHLTNSLPVELEVALRSATWNALIALQSLRSAVRQHVQNECADGASQDDIADGLRSMIDSCNPALHHLDYSAARTDEITQQVLKWSTLFYKPRS